MPDRNQHPDDFSSQSEQIPAETGTDPERKEASPSDPPVIPSQEGSEAAQSSSSPDEKEDRPLSGISRFLKQKYSSSETICNPQTSAPEENPDLLDKGSEAEHPAARKAANSLLHHPRLWQAASGCLVLLLAVSVFAYSAKSSELSKAHKNNDDLSGQIRTLKSEKEDLASQKSALEETNNSLQQQLEELKGKVDELENGSKVQLAAIQTAFEKGEWKKVVELYEPMHEKYNGNDEDKKATDLKNKAQKKIDEEAAAKKAREEEAARKKAEEEAKGYETGITYNQLARTPDDYEGKKVKFSGKVLQVQEGVFSNAIRLAVDGDYDQVVYGTYSKSLLKSNVLEDDWITIYGTSDGDFTYKTVLGASMTIPGISIDKIDQ